MIDCAFRYTLWNAEYRISLMRNFDISSKSSRDLDLLEGDKLVESKGEKFKARDNMSLGDMERIQVFGDLSADAINCIQQLQIELDTVKKVKLLLLRCCIMLLV